MKPDPLTIQDREGRNLHQAVARQFEQSFDQRDLENLTRGDSQSALHDMACRDKKGPNRFDRFKEDDGN